MVQPPGEQEVVSPLSEALGSRNPVRAAREFLVLHHVRKLLLARQAASTTREDHALSCLRFLVNNEVQNGTARIWDHIDDTIDVMAPLLADVRFLTTGVDASLTTISPDIFSQILFNLLLFIEKPSLPGKADIEIFVSCDEGKAVIKFSESAGVPGKYFRQLLDEHGATWTGSSLVVGATRVPTLHHRREIKALLLARSDVERKSMTDRLALLGIEAGSDHAPAEVDLCITFDDTMPAYRAIRKQLGQAVTIWCIDQQMIRFDDRQKPVAWPLHQRRLANELELLDAQRHAHEQAQILIVDDNISNTRLLTMQLEELGYEVDLVRSGEEAFDRTTEQDYTLIFMDIQMPGMDGVATTRKILARRPCRIIGLTAHATEEERELYIEEGMHEVLIKPIRLHRLRDLLYRTSRLPPLAAGRETVNLQRLPVFDIDLALANASFQPGFAEEFLTLLVNDLPGEQQEITDSLDDPSRLKQIVHRLHGAVRYSGTPRLAAAVGKLETALKQENDEMVRQCVNLLLAEIAGLTTWFESNRNIFRSNHRDATA